MRFKLTDELADEICEWLAEGKSLRSWANQEGKPSAALVCKWLADDANARFREQYARAREIQADALFDDCLDIADLNASGGLTSEDIQLRRVRIDTRKWMAGKLRPKVYGDRIDIDQTVRKADVVSDPIDNAGWAAQYATNRVATSGGSSEGSD